MNNIPLAPCLADSPILSSDSPEVPTVMEFHVLRVLDSLEKELQFIRKLAFDEHEVLRLDRIRLATERSLGIVLAATEELCGHAVRELQQQRVARMQKRREDRRTRLLARATGS